MKFYELAATYEQLYQRIADNGGEITDEDERALEALDDQIKDKIDAILTIRLRIKANMAEAQAQLASIEEEAARLRWRRDTAKGSVERLEKYLVAMMTRLGLASYDTGKFKPRVQPNSAFSVAYNGLESLPDRFLRWESTLDREKVIEAHKAGETLPEGLTVTRGSHLRVG